jgi:ferredoxin
VSRAFKVVVDHDLCEDNAFCVRFAPEVFAVDEREEMVLMLERPGEELRGKLEKAVDRCPRAALSLVEDGERGEDG